MCTSLVASLAVSEALLCILPTRSNFTGWYNSSLSYLLDDTVDWKLEPRRYDWGLVNEDNFRGPSLPREKTYGVTRIAVIGGSGAFDLYKNDNATWSVYLGRHLESSLKRPFEVLNAGTPGYSSWQARNLLSSKLMQWRPDAVILYELYNDSLTFRRNDPNEIIRGWKLNAETNFISPSAHPGTWLDSASGVLPFTTDAVRYYWVRGIVDRNFRKHNEFWQDNSLSGVAQSGGLQFYKDNRAAISRICAEAGNIPLIIVSQASIIHTNNSPEEKATILYNYRGMNHANLLEAYGKARAIDRQLAAELPNVEYLPAHEHVPSSLEYFFDEVHLNDRGSRLLAAYIAEELVKRSVFSPQGVNQQSKDRPLRSP